MKKNYINFRSSNFSFVIKNLFFITFFLIFANIAFAQISKEEENDSLEANEEEIEEPIVVPPAVEPGGEFWGYAFGDYAYKGGSDPINRGNTQYSGVPLNTNIFQWRRIYLGYNYDINEKFSAEFLLAAEADVASGSLGATNNGDLLSNNKFAPYIKLGNLRWKNLWQGTDFVFGQMATPAYAKTGRNAQTSEEIWGYRSIEKTITDIAGTNSYDFGAALQGWFDADGNFGYDVMMANGQQAKPENSSYKMFYGDVYLKLLDKHLIIDFYQDYYRLNWSVPVTGNNGTWYHDRNMTKLFVAYTSPFFTIGFEGFRNILMGDVLVNGYDGNKYYRTTKTTAYSIFARGPIKTDLSGNTKLGYFVRYDNFDPSGDLSSIANDLNTKSYSALTSAYDPTTKTQFFVLGLDYSPVKNVHFMPNIWMSTYNATLGANKANFALNPMVSGVNGTDLVYRLTFYYTYGK